MQVVIDIPSAFIDHFRNDRFNDALRRLSTDAHLLAGRYERETAAMLIKAFENAVEVPEHGRLIDADAFIEKQTERICENCDRRRGMKDGKLTKRFVYKIGDAPCRACDTGDMIDYVDDAPVVIPEDKEEDDG